MEKSESNSEKEYFSHEIRDNLMKGLDESFEHLIAEKKKNNETIVFSKNGRLEKIKATDI